MTLQNQTLATLKIDRPPEPDEAKRSSLWILLFLGLLVAGAGAAFWIHRSGVKEVRTALARPAEAGGGAGGAGTVLNASGYVTARRQATVSSKATRKVVEVLLEEGVEVEAGIVLARLDTSNVEASLRLAEAQVAAARSTMGETRALLERAELELKRIRPLAEQRIASPSDLDRA